LSEGIIQKVIESKLERLRRIVLEPPIQAENHDSTYAKIRFGEQIQQELIEEIRGIETKVPNKWQLMIKLIGDNNV